MDATMSEIDEEQEQETTTTSATSSSSWWIQNLTLMEISGSCGDFGTLIPLLVALGRQRAIYLAPTLLGTGIVHILSGVFWDIPMPLQPMKAIASLAIASELNRHEVTIAGIGMGVCFILFGIFKGAIELLHQWIPQSVIGGLQLGVGWKLAIRGIHMIQDLSWLENPYDSKLWSILCGLVCLFCLRGTNTSTLDNTVREEASCCRRIREKFPVGLALFGLGVVLAMLQLGTQTKTGSSTITEEPFLVNALRDATSNEWKTGLLEGTLPQLPLTTLNSCLSVCLLADKLFPNKPQVKRRTVCWSIGLMNLLLCPLGCMPNCHGAGGLAGQYRLGAKSGVSMVVLGIFKIGLAGLAHYGWLLELLDALPVSILGVLLVLAGHELASTGVVRAASQTTTTTGNKDDMTVCLLTGLVIVGSGKTHVGALCGWITYLIHDNGYKNLFIHRVSEASEHSDSSSSDIDPAVEYSQLEQNSSEIQVHES
jgi:MFS superfamily sulfate permease-like transporter